MKSVFVSNRIGIGNMDGWTKLSIKDENGEGLEAIKCGELVMPGFFARNNPNERLQKIKDFEYKEGNVLLCTYPKTGTHWVTNILECLLAEGKVADMPPAHPNLMELMPDERWSIVENSKLISSHLPIDRLPTNYFRKGAKIIIAVRNPKDSMVSMFCHLQNMAMINSKMSWNYFFEIYSKGEVPYGSYFDYYESWEKIIKEEKTADILIVHFEKLKKDGLNEIKRINEFLNLNHSDERLQLILDHLNINKLRDAVNASENKGTIVDESGKSVLYRKGAVGEWKNRFTVAQNEQYNALMEQRKFKDSIFYYE